MKYMTLVVVDPDAAKVTYLDEAWATVKGLGGRIDFQTAPGYRPPAWPDPAGHPFCLPTWDEVPS